MSRVIGLVVVFLLLGAVGGCAGLGPPSTATSPSTSTSPSADASTATSPSADASTSTTTAEPSTPPTSTASPSPSATATATIPTTARAYAEAVLRAWGLRQPTLANLATATTLAQFAAVAGTVNQNWIYDSCVTAGGAAYCRFVNATGDVVSLRINLAALGEPQAATEMALDRTTYPTTASEYVKSFVEAWRNENIRRMQALSTPTEAIYFASLAPPQTYLVCSVISAGVANVRVYNTSGLNHTLTVAVAQLGRDHAITGHSAIPTTC